MLDQTDEKMREIIDPFILVQVWCVDIFVSSCRLFLQMFLAVKSAMSVLL